MNTNVNLLAPVGALAFLGTGFLFLVAALVLIHSLIVRRSARAKFVMLAMLVSAGTYLTAIMIFSLASHEKILARGEEKHFCEIDCHLAYSVVDTRQSRTLGDPPNQTTAQGTYLIVKIKTHFDQSTISPQRGDALLYPNSRVLTVVDQRGNTYPIAGDAQRTIQTAQSSSKPLTTPLRPGQSYTTEAVFDLPVDAKPSTLLINEGEWVTHLVIGHENSLLHRKTRFQL